MNVLYLIIFLIILDLLLIITIIILRYKYKNKLKAEANKLFRLWTEQMLEKEKENIKRELNDIFNEKYKVEFERWKQEFTHKIREETLKKSGEVLKGKVIEQLVPYFKNFPYDPRDARFIGSPIDFVIFDGLRGKGKIERIIFLEIKSGKSKLSENERKIEDVIKEKKVEFRTIYVD